MSNDRCEKTAKIRVKNREPVPAYAMADADRDSDLGDDSPVVSDCLYISQILNFETINRLTLAVINKCKIVSKEQVPLTQ